VIHLFSQIGVPGILILLVICLIAFGSKNLPSVGRSMGESFREFRDALSKNEDPHTIQHDKEKKL
jgi:sec-independent protein translocase protein TatA